MSSSENWVTINGVHVLIGGDGKISKGPSKFIGKTVKEVSKPTTTKSKTTKSTSTKSKSSSKVVSIAEKKKTTGGTSTKSKTTKSSTPKSNSSSPRTSTSSTTKKTTTKKTTGVSTKEKREIKNMSDDRLLKNHEARTMMGKTDSKASAMQDELTRRGYKAVEVDSWGLSRGGAGRNKTIFSKDPEVYTPTHLQTPKTPQKTVQKTIKVTPADGSSVRESLTTQMALKFFNNEIGFASFEKEMQKNNITLAERSVIHTKIEQLGKGNLLTENPTLSKRAIENNKAILKKDAKSSKKTTKKSNPATIGSLTK